MPISSRTLFHFMPEKEFLRMALEKGLWPRYNIERIGARNLAIPMLSFCDIPLSQIKDHIGKYGCYGIGVTKKFARNHKITPVIYLEHKSKMLNKLENYLRNIIVNPSNSFRDIDFREFLLYYAKIYKGKGETGNIIKFYDEREWRFVPEISEKVQMHVSDDEFSEDDKNNLSLLTESCKIKLDAEDIEYIFVKDNSDIHDVVSWIDKVFSTVSKANKKVINLLKSRILTVKQIREDF